MAGKDRFDNWADAEKASDILIQLAVKQGRWRNLSSDLYREAEIAIFRDIVRLRDEISVFCRHVIDECIELGDDYDAADVVYEAKDFRDMLMKRLTKEIVRQFSLEMDTAARAVKKLI